MILTGLVGQFCATALGWNGAAARNASVSSATRAVFIRNLQGATNSAPRPYDVGSATTSANRCRCEPAELTCCHTWRMVSHMKTTLNIDAIVMTKLKREAARQGRTMSELVETALRLLLQSPRRRETLPPLPSFRSGGAQVDVADREALYQAMEGR